MAKRIMYVCFGILALVIAFHLGAQYGHADYVDHSATGVVSGGCGSVLLSNGERWVYDDSGSQWNLYYTLPVPISQIKFWCGSHFVDTADQMWRHDPGGAWFNCGSPPGGVATQSTSWGAIKAEFAE